MFARTPGGSTSATPHSTSPTPQDAPPRSAGRAAFDVPVVLEHPLVGRTPHREGANRRQGCREAEQALRVDVARQKSGQGCLRVGDDPIQARGRVGDRGRLPEPRGQGRSLAALPGPSPEGIDATAGRPGPAHAVCCWSSPFGCYQGCRSLPASRRRYRVRRRRCEVGGASICLCTSPGRTSPFRRPKPSALAARTVTGIPSSTRIVPSRSDIAATDPSALKPNVVAALNAGHRLDRPARRVDEHDPVRFCLPDRRRVFLGSRATVSGDQAWVAMVYVTFASASHVVPVPPALDREGPAWSTSTVVSGPVLGGAAGSCSAPAHSQRSP